MPDSVLFRVQEVVVSLSEFDLPGSTRSEVTCYRCGQAVRDRREVIRDGVPLCRPCAHGSYFQQVREITCPDKNWAALGSFLAAEVHRQEAIEAR